MYFTQLLREREVADGNNIFYGFIFGKRVFAAALFKFNEMRYLFPSANKEN